MDKKIYSVASEHGLVLGLFTTEEKAKACLNYFRKRQPEINFEIDWHYPDLTDYNAPYYKEDKKILFISYI